jgi:hypothetical protein
MVEVRSMTMERVYPETAALPPSVPQRDLRRDFRFEVPQTFDPGPPARLEPIKPRIVSTAHGPIRELMLWYPPGIPDSPPHRAIYMELLEKLPAETRVVLVAHPESISDANALVAERAAEVDVVEAPDWLAFSIWAEDACVVVDDVGADPPVTYIMEPLEFPRYGDSLVGEAVARATPLETGQLPLIFQGGNVLIGDDFVLVGRDYLEDSIDRALQIGAIDGFPFDAERAVQERFIAGLFRRLFDPDKEIHFLGGRPAQRVANWVDEERGRTVGHDVERGSGTQQPIFHIDMFLSLAGRNSKSGRYRVLVGDPKLSDQLLGLDRLPFDKQEEFDLVAEQLDEAGFEVHRTPLPLVASRSRGPDLLLVDGEPVEVDILESWYHPTSSNCLVQIDGDSREVWLPTYGHGNFSDLAAVDEEHQRIWSELGFTVHRLGDFHQFARALGALHCIKKFLRR